MDIVGLRDIYQNKQISFYNRIIFMMTLNDDLH